MHHEGPGSHRPSDKSVVTRAPALAPSSPRQQRFRKNGSQPTVQLGLHPPYRKVRRINTRPLHSTGVHRCIFGHYIPSLTDTLPPQGRPSARYPRSGPFPTAPLRTGRAIFTAPGSPASVSVSALRLRASGVDTRMAGVADDQGFAAACCHSLGPFRLLSPFLALEVFQTSNMMHFDVFL
jgi:hypothetical protein